MFFTMPETSFKRDPSSTTLKAIPDTRDHPELDLNDKGIEISRIETYHSLQNVGNKKTYLQQLSIYNGIFVDEPL
jgi:hypothetical protein